VVHESRKQPGHITLRKLRPVTAIEWKNGESTSNRREKTQSVVVQIVTGTFFCVDQGRAGTGRQVSGTGAGRSPPLLPRGFETELEVGEIAGRKYCTPVAVGILS
jgi:hypothetical protein